MICNGTARSNGSQLVQYLLNSGKNDSAEVLSLSREATLADEIAAMEADARGTRCGKPLYHAQVRSSDDEPMTREQMLRAVDIYAEAMGFQGLPRAAVLHRFEGHDHLHIVFGRIDPETGSARDYKNDYKKQELAGRRMEAEFGHRRQRGRFYDESGEPYTQSEQRKRSHTKTNKAEQGQAQRSDFNPNKRKAEISELWYRTHTGREFRAGLDKLGYTLAKGDRRNFVVVDGKGEVHSLARQILRHDGRVIKAADLNARMVDVNVSELPSVAEVRKQQRIEQGRERKQEARERRGQPPEAAPPQSRAAKLPPSPDARTPRSQAFIDRPGRAPLPVFTDTPVSRARLLDTVLPQSPVSETVSRVARALDAEQQKKAPDAMARGELLGIKRSAFQVANGMYSASDIEAMKASVDQARPGSEEHSMRSQRLREMLGHGVDRVNAVIADIEKHQNKP